MARTQRIKVNRDAHYHVVSRIAGKEFRLNSPEIKSALARTIRIAAAFSGVRIRAWCVMDNHFHLVCQVSGSRRGQTPENVILERVSALKGPEEAAFVRSRLAELRRLGMDGSAEQLLNRWRNRMEDLSEFVKTLKEVFDVWYKRRNPYSGSIWEGRFKSTYVQDGCYLRRCIVYVECNPIRAGLSKRRGEYVWSSSPSDHLCDAPDTIQYANLWGLSPEEERIAGRKVAQMTNGKILGDMGFVLAGIAEFASYMHSTILRPHQIVGSEGYSSHGHRLAAREVVNEVVAV